MNGSKHVAFVAHDNLELETCTYCCEGKNTNLCDCFPTLITTFVISSIVVISENYIYKKNDHEINKL